MKRIKIFDTTLRDGEQSPGCSMNLSEKIEMAQQLEKLGVDIIEAGFAIASPMDHKSVQSIAAAVSNCTVASLARCTILFTGAESGLTMAMILPAFTMLPNPI